MIRRALGFWSRATALDTTKPQQDDRCVYLNCGKAWTTAGSIRTTAGPMCRDHLTADELAEFERRASR